MKISNNIILIILFIIIVYFTWQINLINKKLSFEKFTTDDVKQSIKEIYTADVQAIRTLSTIAAGLLKDGYTVPGNLNITDKLKAKFIEGSYYQGRSQFEDVVIFNGPVFFNKSVSCENLDIMNKLKVMDLEVNNRFYARRQLSNQFL